MYHFKYSFAELSLKSADKSIKIQDFHPVTGSIYGFVFGNEVFGVSEESLKCADIAIEIPQFGTKHSFNITISLGIILWDHYVKTTETHKERGA